MSHESWYEVSDERRHTTQVVFKTSTTSTVPPRISGTLVGPTAALATQEWASITLFLESDGEQGRGPFVFAKANGVIDLLKHRPARLAFAFYRYETGGLLEIFVSVESKAIRERARSPYIVENGHSPGSAESRELIDALIARDSIEICFVADGPEGPCRGHFGVRVEVAPEAAAALEKGWKDLVSWHERIPGERRDPDAAMRQFEIENPIDVDPILEEPRSESVSTKKTGSTGAKEKAQGEVRKPREAATLSKEEKKRRKSEYLEAERTRRKGPTHVPAPAFFDRHELARRGAREWWTTSGRSIADCDRCDATIHRGEGFLCETSSWGLADLMCERCFETDPLPEPFAGSIPKQGGTEMTVRSAPPESRSLKDVLSGWRDEMELGDWLVLLGLALLLIAWGCIGWSFFQGDVRQAEHFELAIPVLTWGRALKYLGIGALPILFGSILTIPIAFFIWSKLFDGRPGVGFLAYGLINLAFGIASLVSA